MRDRLQSLRAFLRPGRSSAAVDRPLLDVAEILALAQRVGAAPSSATREVVHQRLGETRSVYRGHGMDFDESRPFLPGDDTRFMDWRLTARTGQPHVKVFREERRPTVFVLVDRRATMRFGTRVRLKVTQAARAATLIGFAAQRRQAAVAGCMLEQPPRWLAPSSTPDAPLRLAHAAARAAPPLASGDTPTLAEVLALLACSLERGSELWLISDFHDLDASCEPRLLQLASEHQLRAVHVVDPAELSLPKHAGVLRLSPPHGGRAVVLAADGEAARRFAEAAGAYQEARRALFRGLGVPYWCLLSDTDSIEQELPL